MTQQVEALCCVKQQTGKTVVSPNGSLLLMKDILQGCRGQWIGEYNKGAVCNRGCSSKEETGLVFSTLVPTQLQEPSVLSASLLPVSSLQTCR